MIDSVPSVILAGETHSNPLTLFTLLFKSAFHSAFTFFLLPWLTLLFRPLFFFPLSFIFLLTFLSAGHLAIDLQEHLESRF